jgi:hypothetical protein
MNPTKSRRVTNQLCATVLLFVLAFGVGLKGQSHKGIPRTWMPATYKGLVMGKSTRQEVLRVLGKPEWVGRESDTGVATMEFPVSDPVPGKLAVHFPHGEIVNDMTLYPVSRLTDKDILALLGSDYLTVRYATDDCLGDALTAPLYESPDGYIKHLENRSRGLALAFYAHGVEAIHFVHEPFGPTSSRCGGKEPETSANDP